MRLDGMADNDVCFREVIPDEIFPEKWKEFTVNIGGTQALQEVKVPERAGGYAYKDQVKLYSRNRFLYWRTCDDVLELVEQSLDVSLSGRALRIRFPDTPVLEGVSVHEAERAIVVLCATVSSVHRFSFPLPDSLCSEDSSDFLLAHHPDIGIKSIFADTTLSSVRDPTTFHVLNSVASGVGLPHVSASLLTVQGDCLFALGYPSGSVLLVQMGAGGQEVTVRELKEDTYVPRFLSGLTNALTGGRGAPSEAPVSLALHSHGLETHLFCLHRDGMLAMWSCSRVALVSTLDLAQVCGGEAGQRATEGVQSHVLRKAQDARDGPVLLAAFLCFAGGSVLCLAKPSVVPPGGAFRLNLLCTIPASHGDLVDLSVSGGALWAAWRGPEGPLVSRVALGPSLGPWRFAVLDAPLADLEAASPLPGDDADAAETYLRYIFHSPHFSAPVISRALALFRRSGPAGGGGTAAAAAAEGAVGTISWRTLRERVARAVEADIRRQAAGAELTDDDYTELAYASWSRFYSGCVQYAEAAARPLGVVALGHGAHAGAALLKRTVFSLLRPMDALEQQMLTNALPDASTLSRPCGSPRWDDCSNSGAEEAAAEEAGVRALVSALALLEARCPPELKAACDAALEDAANPETKLAQLLRAPPTPETEPLLQADFLQELSHRLSTAGDLCIAVGALLRRLAMVPSEVEADALSDALAPGPGPTPSPPPPHLAALLASHTGLSIAARTLHQICSARLSACRTLLLLLRLLAERRLSTGVSGSGAPLGAARADALRSALAPHAVVAAQALHSLAWLGTQPAARASRPSLDAAAELLAAAGAQRLSAASRAHAAHHSTASAEASRSPSLLTLLLRGPLGVAARLALAARPPPEEALCGAGAALPLALALGRAAWPAREEPAACASALLLAAGQFRAAAEHERLLAGWCEGGVPLRRFALGTALLLGGEPRKALDALQAVAAPRDAARRLLEQLGSGDDCESASGDTLSPAAQYALLLARLFSLGKHWDLVLAVAEAAAARAQANVPGGGVEERATLQLVAFSAELRLGRLTGAFHALLAIPDRQRARLCLRQLVAHAFERRQLRQLLAFPYGALVDDLSAQVLLRARAQAPDASPHYAFLYALHMGRGAARKAATAMLEQALRARAELPATMTGVRLRARCLLACLNALRLSHPNYRWLVRPEPGAMATNEDKDGEDTEDGMKLRGNSTSALARRRAEDASVLALAPRRRVAVLELRDVEREYLLAAAHMQLLRRDNSGLGIIAGDLSPAEVVGACTSAGLYDTALQVALRWRLPCEPVVRHLATECVDLTRRGMLNSPQTWSWLKDNDVWEFGIGDAPALSLAWKLLEVLLVRLEPAGTASKEVVESPAGVWDATQRAADNHLAAAGAVLRCGAFLPLWLLRACAMRSAPRLLRLLMSAGRLEDAATLAVAALQHTLRRIAHDSSLIQAKIDLAPNRFCMPVHLMDVLLMELEEAIQGDPRTYTEPMKKLEWVRNEYVEKVRVPSL